MLSAASPPLPKKKNSEKCPLTNLKTTWKLVGP